MNKAYHPIKNNAACEKIVRGTSHGVLSMADASEPYALPMNHAYQDGRLYFHCGIKGRKLDIIARNPKVTYVIMKYSGERDKSGDAARCHGSWESVIVYGKARIVSDKEELVATFRTFMRQYGSDDYQPSEDLSEKTRAIIIEVDMMTVRREPEGGATEYWVWERES